jgi:hypothetical protein
MQVAGQLGSMDPMAFDRAFDGMLGELQKCHTQRLQRIRWLAGDVKFFLRIGEDGSTRYGFMEDSTLGDRDAESCMMRVLLDAHWPQPRGGEAEVRKSIGFDAPGDVKAPVSWGSDEITPALTANNAQIRACRKSIDGSFKATAYVVAGPPAGSSADRAKAAPGKKSGKREAPKRGKRPDTKPHGHFLTIGIAPPSKEGLESIDCLIDTLKQMPVPSPGSSPAKVTFSL